MQVRGGRPAAHHPLKDFRGIPRGICPVWVVLWHAPASAEPCLKTESSEISGANDQRELRQWLDRARPEDTPMMC